MVEDVVGASKAKKQNVADDENRASHFNKCGASLLYKNEQAENASQYRSEIATEQWKDKINPFNDKELQRDSDNLVIFDF